MEPGNIFLPVLLLLLAGAHAIRPIAVDTGNGIALEAVLFPRPPYEEHALMARWLVHETSWGVLSTLDMATGEPVGGVVSHSDGPRSSPSGRLFFYITPMDELTQNAMAHPRCSFTISEQQRRGPGSPAAAPGSDRDSDSGSDSGVGDRPCGGLDPEDPACARATLLGRLERVAASEREEAQAAMFSRHPRMADWPTDHNFEFYELHVDEVHLLDWYGGMAVVPGEDYYQAAVAEGAAEEPAT